MSMIPTTDPGKLLRESEPLVAYLKSKLGRDVTLTIPTNYAGVVEAVLRNETRRYAVKLWRKRVVVDKR